MEEVWKDYMSLQPSTGNHAAAASLYHYQRRQQQQSPPSPPCSSSSYRGAGILLQDFLASAPMPLSLPSPPQPPTPPPLPPTVLSLSSTLEFTYLGGSSASGDDSRDLMPPSDIMFGAFPPVAPRLMHSNCGGGGGGVGGDRRQRRMIKNRESAARSRARKQAYTNELELKLQKLRQENAVLLQRHRDLHVRLAATAQVPDRRPSAQRCRSAPPALDIIFNEM
ncbi:hypothetical protein ACP70R_029118 [Stipagrostis hirtigluma subsp. patula]